MRIYFRGILQKLVYTELFLVNQNIHYPKYSKYIFAWLLFSIVFLFLSKKKYCSNIYPFSWSTEMLTQFCSKRLDFSKVVTILLKRNYFRKRFCFCFFFSQETLRDICLAILRNSSSDCFSPFLCYMNVSSHYKPEADTQNRSEPRASQQNEPYHRINSLMKPTSELSFVMPLSFKTGWAIFC